MNTQEYISREELQLARGKIAPLFRKFAIPGVIGLLFIGIQTIIDGIILGNFVGANALASVSLTTPAFTLMSSISIVMGIGCQTVVSMRLGQSNPKGANDALATGFWSLMFFSILIGVFLFSFARPIASLLGANSVLIDDSTQYLRHLVPFFPMLSLMFLSDYIIKAIGRPVYAVTVMSITVIINILLDLLFIVEFGWGTTGAALATGIAFSIGALCNLPQIINRKKIIALCKGRFRNTLLWRMLYNGSSEGMSELSVGITIFLFNRAMMYYLGESGVAAFTAINYVMFIGITVFLGISDGIIPIISYNFGATRWDRIQKVFTLAIKTNIVIGVVLFTVLIFFREQIISLFFDTTKDSHVIEIAVAGTSIYAIAFLFNGLNILFSSYFTALGNAKVSIIISLLRSLIFTSLGIAILPVMFGIEGIWYVVPIAEVLTFAVGLTLVRKSHKWY